MQTSAVLVAAALAVGVVPGGYLLLGSHAPAPAAPVVPAAHASLDRFVPMSSPVSFPDPSGDATDTGTGLLDAGCVASDLLGPDCQPDGLPSAGTAAPALDILRVSLAGETRDAFDLALDLARLDEGFANLPAPEAMHRTTTFRVCWSPGDGACDRAAALHLMVHDGMAHVDPHLHIFSEKCNEWGLCTWGVPYEVRFGSPARITFHVPKALASFDGAPLAVGTVRGSTEWYEEPQALAMWHAGATLHTPLRHVHDHVATPGPWGQADATDAFAAAQPLAPSAALPDAGRAMLAEGMMGTHLKGSSHDDPALDLVGVDLFEERGDLVAAFVLAEAHRMPGFDFDDVVAVGLDGLVWEIGVRQHDGVAHGYAGRCIMFECQGAPLLETEALLLPGAPAVLEVRVPLAFLGDPAPGTVTSLLEAATMHDEPDVMLGGMADPLHAEAHSAFMVDMLSGGAPYVVGSGHHGVLAMPAGHHH
jgi:hypothetical protein